MENRINEEVVKKEAIKFYLSLHANLHQSSDETHLTGPPAVLNTDTMGVYDSKEICDILNGTYEDLVSAVENFEHRESGWVLGKLLKLDWHILEFNPFTTLHSSS